MEQRERDESSSKLEEALRELTGAETTGKIEEYENEREGADVDSETACTDMRRAERMPAWRQEEDARKSKLSESRADVVNELNDDDWEQEELDELDEWDEPAKSPRGMGRLAAVFRPSDDLLAAFFLPVVILILIFAYRGIFPFGQESFLRTDMYHQYAPFFSEFRHKLLSGESLLYSWDVGMGVNFAALYAYYLASPFNWLLLLCPSSLIIEFMTYMIVFKSGLAGLSMAWYLKKHTGSQKFGACYFGVFYALSGYMAAYSWNIMWLDCILLFPVIMLGLEQLVKEGKGLLYGISLGVCILSNYYISIMICIFLVFYFILLFFTQKGGKLKAFLRFAWYSLLAGSVSMVLLLPEIAVLSASGSAEDSFPKTLEWYFSVIAELGRAAAVTTSYTGNDHWPNLYAGAFTLVLVWLYVLNRRISWKEKVPRMLMLVFFLVSFADNQLDYIWHGMHFPQALPGRQSFLYIFMLLVMGFATIRKWKGTRRWHIIIAVLAALTLMVLSGYYGDELVTEYMAVVITMLFILVYGILLLLLKIAPKKMRIALREAAFCVAIAELAVNMAVTGLGVTSRVAYTDKQGYYEDLLQQAKEDNGNDGFYRVEDSGRKTKNDDSLYGYRSATIFSSLMNLDVSHLFQSLYMEGGKNFYCYNGASPLPSAMFSVKYMLSSNPEDESPLRTFVGSSNGNYLYRNNYCLPLGYMMSEKAIRGWESSMLDRIGSLNSLAQQLGAKGDMLYPAACTQSQAAGDTTIDISEDGYYYADYVTCNADSLTVSRDDGWTQQYGKTTHRYLLDLGECKAGTKVHITNLNAETIEYHVYRLNFKAMCTAYETLSEQTMSLEKMTDRRIVGSIDVRQAGRLILSVPADEGWTLYVDGKKTKIKPFADALIGVHLKEGTHKIELRYTTPGVQIGAAISIAALLLFLFSMWIRYKTRGKHGEKMHQYRRTDVQ